MHLRPWLALGALYAFLWPGLLSAQAPAWPAKPVKLIVAYPPGGTTDVAARLLAERMSASLGSRWWSRIAPARAA